MTPIEKVTPALPGNWTRRPETKIKRGGEPGKDRNPADKKRSGPGSDRRPGAGPDERQHIVDELA